jgi:hypothetical protein
MTAAAELVFLPLAKGRKTTLLLQTIVSFVFVITPVVSVNILDFILKS